MRRAHTGLARRKARGRTFLIILATVVAASGWPPRQASGQQIIQIDASALGGTNVSPQAINNAGQVVGSYEASNGVTHAFVWKNGVMVDIETDPNATSTALAINDSGVVVGQTTDTDGDTIAFRWEAPGAMVRLTVFDGQSIAGRESTAQDINNNGVIVGYARAPSLFGLVDRAYRMTGSGPGQQIGGLNVLNSRAFAINDSAQIVGQSDSEFPNLITRATFWNPSPIQLDTATSAARDVNNSGKAVGERGISPQRARLWQLNPNNQPIGTSLNPLPGHTHSAASGIRDEAGSADPTQVVGISFNSSTEARAVRWLVDAQGTPTVQDLNDLRPAGSGWVLQRAKAINDRGQIVGTGNFQGNAGRGYLFDPLGVEPNPPAVLFLHGLLASFLYKVPGETLLWPALFDEQLEVLGSAGFTGGKFGVFTKERDIINEFGPLNVYKDFSQFMDDQKRDRVINDWYPYAYDWRQDWGMIVDEGTIYSASCFEPQGGFFIPNCNLCGVCLNLEDKIVELATSQGPAEPGAPQPTPRKVWIVAHSNGGLLAKTLLGKLKADPMKADVLAHVAGLILVASPQLGTPKALSPLLHGDEYTYFIASNPALRTAVSKMPGAYQLLPTARYFGRVQDPVIEFEESGFGGGLEVDLWKDRYNSAVDSFFQMQEFLLGTGGARKDLTPTTRIDWPAILYTDIFSQSQDRHAEIELGFDADLARQALPFPVYQIVGSGLPTIRGLKYGSKDLRGSLLETLKTCDGDETVVVPSAAALPNATSYFVDLPEHNHRRGRNNSHGTIMNVEDIQTLIVRLMQGNPVIDDLKFIGTSKPVTPCKYGFLRTRSPAEIHLFQEGLHTGPVQAPDIEGGFPLIEEGIPNSQYDSLAEGREALVDGVGTYEVRVEGTGVGTVTLEGGRFEGDSTENVFEVPGIPILKGSRIEFQFDPTAASPPPMTMDVDGDGTPDLNLSTGAPPGPEVFLQVLSAAVDKLGMATAAADLPGSTLRALREEFLQEARRALEDAGEDPLGKPRRIVAKLELARKALRGYLNRLEREVARGRVGDAVAQPLTENAAAIVSLLEIAQERLVPPLGHMEGEGRVHAGGLRYDFDFEVRETGKGKDEGRLTLKVRTTQPGRDHDDDDDRDHGRRRIDRFETTHIADAVFADDPDLMPGGRRTKTDTVLILGEGRWNGRRGFTFEATATDAGEPGAARDSFAITIRDPGGVVVATVSGLLTKGNNQAKRSTR